MNLSNVSTDDLWKEVYYRALKNKALSLGNDLSDEDACSLAEFAVLTGDNEEDLLSRNEDLLTKL